jgi:anthranilate phosphoribosyltransferase
VPTQALTLMNSSMVRQQAEKLAAAIRSSVTSSPEAQITEAFQRALGRSPTEGELTRMADFVRQQQAAVPADTPNADLLAFTEFCHVLMCLNEFVYVD